MKPFVRKGDWIRAQWLRATDACLAGCMPKVGAEGIDVSGIVRHVRGDHPTTPTTVRLYVDPDDGQGTVTPPGCTCGPHVEVNPDHVVDWRQG